MTWARAAAGLVAALVPVALVACGAAQRPAMAPGTDAQPGSAGGPLAPVAEVHAEIDTLDAALQRDRDQLGVAAPDALAVAAAHPMAADAVGATCVRATSTTCTDVCTLADAICGNADRICELAATLPGDAWAEQRCDAGKATCQAAGERCCSCAGP